MRQKILLVRSALLLILTLFCLPAVAGSGVKQMTHFLENLTTLQASFEQSVLDPNQTRATRSQGVFSLQKPGRFRWDYSEPENQQIIADGRQIWLYEPDLEQASVQWQDSALKGTPAMLLISGDPVGKHYEVIDIGESQGLDWVELIPLDQESQFIRVLLAFHGGDLLRMEMSDKFGQTTRFQFHDIKHNPVFEGDFFTFEPPAYLDLYRN